MSESLSATPAPVVEAVATDVPVVARLEAPAWDGQCKQNPHRVINGKECCPLGIPRKTIETWAKLKKTHPVMLRAAAIAAGWQYGEQFDPLHLTEATFDHAISFAENPHAHANPPKPATPEEA